MMFEVWFWAVHMYVRSNIGRVVGLDWSGVEWVKEESFTDGEWMEG